MNTNEIENMKNMEKNKNRNMDEKVHYEIKFVETEDGYRLEATGDKKALKRLGIGPNMVGRKLRGGHRGRKDWPRARHARRMGPWQRRRAAMMARRAEGMCGPGRFAQDTGPDSFDFTESPRRRPRRKYGRRAGHGHGRPEGMRRPGRFEQGPGPDSIDFADGPRRKHGRHPGHRHGRPDFGQITWEW